MIRLEEVYIILVLKAGGGYKVILLRTRLSYQVRYDLSIIHDFQITSPLPSAILGLFFDPPMKQRDVFVGVLPRLSCYLLPPLSPYHSHSLNLSLFTSSNALLVFCIMYTYPCEHVQGGARDRSPGLQLLGNLLDESYPPHTQVIHIHLVYLLNVQEVVTHFIW